MTNESEAARMYSINVPGHDYELHNFEGGSVQNIKFIQKEVVNGELKTVTNGTTNEAVLQVLINRMKHLDVVMPCEENKIALANLINALEILEKRTADRKTRGVEGKKEA